MLMLVLVVVMMISAFTEHLHVPGSLPSALCISDQHYRAGIIVVFQKLDR